jgi:uncharacterized protein (TIGR03437 family)
MQAIPQTRRPVTIAARSAVALAVLLAVVPQGLIAQQTRITTKIDNSRRVTLPGHMRAGVVPANDQGRVDASLQLPYITLALKPSAAQQADLTALLQQQQDPSSPNFHRWLTPEQYAERFGAAQSDIDKITAWLQSQGLTVLSVARGRNSISFSGPVRSVEAAFGTEIHHYLVNGELHFANATNPAVPAAMSGLALAIHGLDDFKMRPANRKSSAVMKPGYINSACSGFCLAPADFATIYDLTPLYKAGITGAGQTLAIVGQTQVNPADISTFRAAFGFSSTLPTMVQVPNTPNPGVSNGDLVEADLDLEWSGAIAPNATIIYVYSNDVEASVEYAIDQNIAPVVSMSYGQCEEPTSADQGATSGDAATLQQFAQRANSQGMTWIAAAGDSGAADCYGESGLPQSVIDSATVDYPGSIPYVTSVGGLEFNEGSGSFWSSSGNALSYIPEMVWNDSVNDGGPSSGGGGASLFFSKPSWQAANGVPNDGARDVPDISFSGSADHDGYLIYNSNYSKRSGTFGSSQPTQIGGTSAGAPSMAGILALLNQYLLQNGYQAKAGVGNINPRLYQLQSTGGVFHDITVGNNMVNPCEGTRNVCTNTAVGYNAGPGYDLASGLGSMDINAMVHAWPPSTTTNKGTVAISLTATSTSLAATGSTTLTASMKPSGSGTPTGSVTFSAGSVVLGSATLSGGSANLTVNASSLITGSNTVTAVYAGDANFNGGSAAITISVAPSTSISISGLTNAASFAQGYAPGMILAIFGSNLGPSSPQQASTVPLSASLGGVSVTIAGVPCPLYYVSPGQLNVQIPYNVPVNTTSTLVVSYNGQTGSAPIKVASAAPGVFFVVGTSDAVVTTYTNGTIANGTSAAPGSVISIYITGDGAESPTVTTGSTPSPNTRPVQAVALTVGGSAVAPLFVGVPSWSVGVTQINFTVPASAIPGTNLQIIVTVGGVASSPVSVNIVQ